MTLPGMSWGDASWSDTLQARLFERRTVLVVGVLDDARAAELAAQLMTLDALGDAPIAIHLDSADGTLEAAFALMDVVDLVGCPVHATCLGRLEGPPVGVFAVADVRRIARHAHLRLKEPHVDFAGSATDINRWAEHHRRHLERFVARLAEAVGRPFERVEADVEAGRYLDAAEAVAYGIADEIVTSTAEVKGVGGPHPFGFQPPRLEPPGF